MLAMRMLCSDVMQIPLARSFWDITMSDSLQKLRLTPSIWTSRNTLRPSLTLWQLFSRNLDSLLPHPPYEWFPAEYLTDMYWNRLRSSDLSPPSKSNQLTNLSSLQWSEQFLRMRRMEWEESNSHFRMKEKDASCVGCASRSKLARKYMKFR